MAAAVGTMQVGEAVRLECLSRTFHAEVSEVRAWTWAGASIAMVALVTRGRVPRRELPPGELVTLHAADGSRWEGAIGGSLDSAASIVLQQSPVAHEAMIPNDAIDLPPAQGGIAENEQVPEATGAQRGVPDQPRDFGVPLVLRAAAQQAMIPHEAYNLPPAEDGIAENEQDAKIQLPVQEATGAQRGVPDQPRDFGVPLVLRAVPRPAALKFVDPPVHQEIKGKARNGKNCRRERKEKSAEKGKYG